MATLPATGYLENASRTVSEMKTALESVRDVASVQPGGAARTELTIASGSVTPATRDHGSNFTIDTEGGAASDDLDVIAQTNMPEGSVIRVWAENASRVVTLKDANGGAGEMLMVDSADFVLDATDKWVEFERRSTSWVEVARSYGLEGEITNLTTVASLEDADVFAVHDDSAGAPRGITRANLGAQLADKMDWHVIASGTASAVSSLDVTGLTTDYRAYILMFDDLAPSTDNVELFLRLSDDDGSTYEADASDYAWANSFASEGAAASNTGDGADSEMSLGPSHGSGATEMASGQVTLYNPADTGRTQATWSMVKQNQVPNFIAHHGGGQIQTDGATTAFRLLFSSGNIATMNYTLYGLRAS